jgi:Domain of unknown function (DUF3381)
LIKDLKPPSDLDSICQDLKVCGRRELQELLKLKYKVGVAEERRRKEEKELRKQGHEEEEMT